MPSPPGRFSITIGWSHFLVSLSANKRAPISAPLPGPSVRMNLTDRVGHDCAARGPDGLLDGKSTGQPSKLNDTQRQAIAGMIESGPIPAVHGVVRWRLIDLAQWIFEEFRITIAKQTLSRELRAMGYRKLSARPRHHAQAEGAIE